MSCRAAIMLTVCASVSVQVLCGCVSKSRPWLDRCRSAQSRTELVLAAMTRDEKFGLLSGYFATPRFGSYQPPAAVRPYSAGYVPAIDRLGIPAQWETDGGNGVATQPGPTPRQRTALPSGIAMAATWNPAIAQAGGAMIGQEARLSGFNVMLAGAVNLTREPRNGRTFEYGGEDPLLAGTMVGAQIQGIQSNHVISTLKHYAFNDQETLRKSINVSIADDQARMSDLLAFEVALETGHPGAVMCSYNRIDTVYACENGHALNEVLKRDWGFRGFVMSDWGAVHSTIDAANNGLDQESGAIFDKEQYFGTPLERAVEAGNVSSERLDDMAARILWAMFDKGLIDYPVADQPEKIDYNAHAHVSEAAAEESFVLLKNVSRVLPLARGIGKIAIIGGHADVGVISGGGSAQVYPRGGTGFNADPAKWPGPELYNPSSPMRALQQRLTDTVILYDDGLDATSAAHLAASSDVAIVFATQWAAESQDTPFVLRDGQDFLISAVAAANPRTIVVLETGNAVAMPWVNDVAAIMEAWFPGTQGGEAIARVLTGDVNPSGKLPITFQRSEDQLPHPQVSQDGSISYSEGAAVGYKWFDSKGDEPLFPFGYGLSYTSFDYSALKTRRDGKVTVTFTLRNSGKVAGRETAQVYASARDGGWEGPKRLVGFRKVELAPNAHRAIKLEIDPRLLAVFDSATNSWRIAAGDYDITLGASSRDIRATTTLRFDVRTLPATYRPVER